MSNSTAAHRDDSHRKSRAVRLGAILLAVVGVTAAATSAGFSNDAWFAASASSASVSLEASLTSGENAVWQKADAKDGAVAITVDSAVFDNMVPDQSRSTTVYLRNAGSTGLTVAATDFETSGDLLDSANTNVTIEVSGTDLVQNGKVQNATVNLAKDEVVAAQITVTPNPEKWTADLQNETSAENTLAIDFTGTTVVADSAND